MQKHQAAVSNTLGESSAREKLAHFLLHHGPGDGRNMGTDIDQSQITDILVKGNQTHSAALSAIPACPNLTANVAQAVLLKPDEQTNARKGAHTEI
jgi:hypothetical protein